MPKCGETDPSRPLGVGNLTGCIEDKDVRECDFDSLDGDSRNAIGKSKSSHRRLRTCPGPTAEYNSSDEDYEEYEDDENGDGDGDDDDDEDVDADDEDVDADNEVVDADGEGGTSGGGTSGGGTSGGGTSGGKKRKKKGGKKARIMKRRRKKGVRDRDGDEDPEYYERLANSYAPYSFWWWYYKMISIMYMRTSFMRSFGRRFGRKYLKSFLTLRGWMKLVFNFRVTFTRMVCLAYYLLFFVIYKNAYYWSIVKGLTLSMSGLRFIFFTGRRLQEDCDKRAEKARQAEARQEMMKKYNIDPNNKGNKPCTFGWF